MLSVLSCPLPANADPALSYQPGIGTWGESKPILF